MRTLEQIGVDINVLIAADLLPHINTEEKRQAEIHRIQKEEAQDFLNKTDWYVIRKIERNIDIPEEISSERLEAIAILND